MPDTCFDNGLGSAETERLALLGEECGKVSTRIGEILREGYPNRHPDAAGEGSRRENLEREIGDMLWAVDLMAHCGDVSTLRARADGGRHARKMRNLHHQDGQGVS